MRYYFCFLFFNFVSTFAGVELSGFRLFIYTHYYDSNLIGRAISLRVGEVIPLDHPPRDTILYGRSNYYHNIIFIILTYLDIILMLLIVLVFNPEKCGNFGHYVSFLDIESSCFPSLVPGLKFTLRNIAVKHVTIIDLV